SIRSNLVGAHNVENLLGVMALLEALVTTGDLTASDVAAAAEALGQPAAVPGRLERCDGPDDDLVAVVDYAHTPDALARILESLRALTTGKLWCVFGCGGDRDPAKRGPMGAAVAVGADVAIVTNDNPRSESPEAIAEAVVSGLRGAGARGFEVVLDRAKAIAMAVSRANPGDVVLVAGKGHEPYQVIGDRTLDFDDRITLKAALRRRREEG
ncbi:MAG: cyanophycin synthetase, partial [Planctomycetota bacterium]